MRTSPETVADSRMRIDRAVPRSRAHEDARAKPSAAARHALGRALVAAAVLAGPCGCKTGPYAGKGAASRTSRSAADRKSGASASKSDARAPEDVAAAAIDAPVEPGSTLDQRLVRIDAAVKEWDAAQGAGREADATRLSAALRTAVDRDYAFFEAASKGASGVRAQNLAVEALAFSANPGATALLAARLGDLETSVVGNALIALKIRSDPQTPLGPIVALIRGNFAEARRYAPLAFANVVRAREAAGRPIEAKLSDQAMAALVPLVSDGDPYARLHTAKAMGALRRPDSVDFLAMLLQDERATIRIAAAAALERIGDPRSFPDVVALLDRVPDDQKDLVVAILVSWAGKLQKRPLTPQERVALSTSPRAWDRWFCAREVDASGGGARPAPAGAPPARPGG